MLLVTQALIVSTQACLFDFAHVKICLGDIYGDKN